MIMFDRHDRHQRELNIAMSHTRHTTAHGSASSNNDEIFLVMLYVYTHMVNSKTNETIQSLNLL